MGPTETLRAPLPAAHLIWANSVKRHFNCRTDHAWSASSHLLQTSRCRLRCGSHKGIFSTSSAAYFMCLFSRCQARLAEQKGYGRNQGQQCQRWWWTGHAANTTASSFSSTYYYCFALLNDFHQQMKLSTNRFHFLKCKKKSSSTKL